MRVLVETDLCIDSLPLLPSLPGPLRYTAVSLQATLGQLSGQPLQLTMQTGEHLIRLLLHLSHAGGHLGNQNCI